MPPPPALPLKVQHELTSLTAGMERGIKLVPEFDRPSHRFTVYLTDPDLLQPSSEIVRVDVLLPDDYPRSPPTVKLPAGRVTAGAHIVDAQGAVSSPALIGKEEWAGIYGDNYENQLIAVLRGLQKLLFTTWAPSPAPAPPAVLVAQVGGGGVQHAIGGGGASGGAAAAAPAPAAQAQPQSSGNPFRLSYCRGRARQYGGSMIGRALKQLRMATQPDGRDWRHTVSSESLATACRAIGEQGPSNENSGPTKGFRVWNLTDAAVTVGWDGQDASTEIVPYDPRDCDEGQRLVRAHANPSCATTNLL